jgi:iron complex transport system ATP-binding protein
MSDPIIQVEDLCFTVAGHKILRGVSLAVGAGEYTSIIGPNGAGKTTLIKCLAGIHPGWSGRINICGRPFTSYRARERGRLMSYVPQAEGRANPLSVEEFVAMGRYPHLSAFTTLKSVDYRAIETAIGRAGLEQLRHRRMNTLSGGERQMAFIAAALAQDAGILLLDEPSTFLDYRHQAEVSALLQSACRENGITVVAVHHDINTAAACSDRIFAIRDGIPAFSGTPQEAVNPEVLQRVYGTAFSTVSAPGRSLPYIAAEGRS